MKKTVHLRDMIEEVNRRNRGSYCDPKVREGWNSLLEGFLMDADAYDGFRYVRWEDMESPATVHDGQLPGIDQDEDGTKIFPDETRKLYNIHHKIR